jgi:hypothetical protein
MTSESKNQNTSALRNRIALDNESVQKVDQWVEQVNREAKGVRIKRNELVDWLIKSLPDTLKSRQIKRISNQFYDAVVDMESALKKAKEARARGEPIPSIELPKSRVVVPPRAQKQQSKVVITPASNNNFSSEIAPKSDQKKSANFSIS